MHKPSFNHIPFFTHSLTTLLETYKVKYLLIYAFIYLIDHCEGLSKNRSKNKSDYFLLTSLSRLIYIQEHKFAVHK